MTNNSYLFLIKSSVISLLLTAALAGFEYFNIFWMLLSFSYWVARFDVKNPEYFALIAGLFVDIIQGDILGQNSLALILSSLFLLKVKQSFFTSNISTEQVYIFILSIIYLSVIYTVHLISITDFYINPYIFISIISTPIAWIAIRWLFKIL